MSRTLRVLPVLLGLSFLGATPASTQVYKYVYDGQAVTVPMQEKDGVQVNDLCMNEGENCEAWKALQGPSGLKRLKHVEQGMAAAQYCGVFKAQTLLVKADDGSTEAFCVFSDKSMISAGGLYGAHFRRGEAAPRIGKAQRNSRKVPEKKSGSAEE